jgi:hypothetical protein
MHGPRRQSPSAMPLAGTSHLLHHQRNHANYFIERPYSGPITVSSTQTRQGHRRDTPALPTALSLPAAYTISTVLPTPTFTPNRPAPTRPTQSVTISGCDRGHDHLLHHQRNDADHFIERRTRGPITVSRRTETLEAIAVANRLDQQRCSYLGLHDPRCSDSGTFTPSRREHTWVRRQSLSANATVGRNDLLHHQWNRTDDLIDHVHGGPDHCKRRTETLGAIAVEATGFRPTVRSLPPCLHHRQVLPTPVPYSPSAGTYTSTAQTVTISGCNCGHNHLLHHQRNRADNLLGASIHLPNHGERPAETLKAIAVADRLHQQCLWPRLPYTIAPPAATPTFSASSRHIHICPER